MTLSFTPLNKGLHGRKGAASRGAKKGVARIIRCRIEESGITRTAFFKHPHTLDLFTFTPLTARKASG